MPSDTRGVVRLVAADRQAHHRQPVGEGRMDRAKAGVRDDRRGVRQHARMRDMTLQVDVRWRPPSELDAAGRDQGSYRKRAERLDDPLQQGVVRLVRRAQPDDHQRTIVVRGPGRRPRRGPCVRP